VPRGSARRPLKGVRRRVWKATIKALIISIGPKNRDVLPFHPKLLKGVSKAHEVYVVAVIVGLRREPPCEQDHLEGEPTRERIRRERVGDEAHHELGSL
jgi:hypothetical protein